MTTAREINPIGLRAYARLAEARVANAEACGVSAGELAKWRGVADCVFAAATAYAALTAAETALSNLLRGDVVTPGDLAAAIAEAQAGKAAIEKAYA